MKERENSPVVINENIQKIYDFNEAGDKLLSFYEVHTYEYLLEGYDMNNEKENYSCEDYENYGFKSCMITTKKIKL